MARRKFSYYRTQQFIVDFKSDFSGIPGFIYKTHDPAPPKTLSLNAKVIYVFGDPRVAAISIHKNLNSERAYVNAHSDKWLEHEDIFSNDLMRLNDNFNNRYRAQGFPFVSVRYDSLFKRSTQRIMEDYLGVSLNFPSYKEREAKIWDHPKYEQLEQTYGLLAKKVAEADPVKIWESL